MILVKFKEEVVTWELARVTMCSTPTDHGAPKRDRLLEMLALPKEELSEEEYTKIVEFLCSNSEHWTNQS